MASYQTLGGIAGESETRRVKTGSYAECCDCGDKVYRPLAGRSQRKRCDDCSEIERLRVKRANSRKAAAVRAGQGKTAPRATKAVPAAPPPPRANVDAFKGTPFGAFLGLAA